MAGIFPRPLFKLVQDRRTAQTRGSDRLPRDALATLLSGKGPAHGAFTRYFFDNRLKGDLTHATKKVIVDVDPRAALIDLYVEDLTGSSIQEWKDLARCRESG